MTGRLASIVVNNYNYGRFLRRAIDSALAQTHARTEVIVVDDGSTDESRSIIADYGDKIVAVLKDNGGQASALNAGFRASRGEIVVFLDADDFLSPNALECVAKVWRPNVAKVQFRLKVIDEDGNPLGGVVPTARIRSGDLSSLLLAVGAIPSPPTSGNAFSGRFLAQVLPIPEKDWRISADTYLVFLSPLFGEIVSIHEPLGCYRVHASNRWGARQLDAARLRFLLDQDVRQERLLRTALSRLGHRTPSASCIRSLGHLKTRLASLKIAARMHPFTDDTIWGLVLRGVRASLFDPFLTPLSRLASALWFVGIGTLPTPFCKPLLSWGLLASSRPRLLSWLSRG